MAFTFAGLPCFDPKAAAAACVQRGIPTRWFGLANSFSNPLGGAPGRGWLLMARRDLDTLDIGGQSDELRELVITDPSGFGKYKLPAILMTGAMEAVHPGAPADPAALFSVEIADRRWLEWERGSPLFKAYNCRTDRDASYIAATLNGGTAWTWQEMLDDLWPSSLGTAPTLPFTPHGTPEMFWFTGRTKLWAHDHVLARLACALKYDPVANTFRIKRLGASTDNAPTTALLNKYNGHLLSDTYALTTRTAKLPATIRVRFRVKIPYADGTPSFVTHDYAVTPTAGPLAAGTYVLLNDDLIALTTDGSTISNTSELEARRDERGDDWVRKRQYFDTGIHRTYSGMLPLQAAVGSKWRAICWKDVGAGCQTELGGADVEDSSLEGWDFNPAVLHEADGDNDSACQKFVEDVDCVNGVMVKNIKYMRGSFTVSDSPCAGLGGSGGGGPGGGSGGGPGSGGGTGGTGGTPPPGQQCPPGTTWTSGDLGGGMIGWGCFPIGGQQQDCPLGTYWGYSEMYGGWACIPFPYSFSPGGSLPGGSGPLGGPGLAAGGILGGGRTVDYSLPSGTVGQVLSWDAGGTPTVITAATAMPTNTVTPADLSADQNDYAPGACGQLSLNTDGLGNRRITGLSIGQVEGQRLLIINRASVDSIILDVEDAASSAANRFVNQQINDITDITIGPQNAAEFIYVSSRFRRLE